MFVHQQDTPGVRLPFRSRTLPWLTSIRWLVPVRWEPLRKRKILRVFSHRTPQNCHLTGHVDFLILSCLSGMILT